MSNVLIDKNKIDILANAISVKSGEPVTMTLAKMVEAVDSIDNTGIHPTGSITITESGETDVTEYATATVPKLQTLALDRSWQYITENGQRKWAIQPKASNSHSKGGMVDSYQYFEGPWYKFAAIPTGTSVTPTESSQTVGGPNTMMEGAVTVAAIPSTYVGSGISTKSSASLTVNGATVTVPAGYYANAATKAVAAGSVTAPSSITGTSASVSTASNSVTFTKTVSVTPNVTNAGYISSGTAGNSSVSLTASITPRNSGSLTASGATVTAPAGYYPNAATKAVAAGSAGTPTASKGTVSNHAVSVTPSVTNTTGYITGGTKTGTAVSVSASQLVSGTKSITANAEGIDVTNYASVDVAVPSDAPTLQTKNVTYTPSESQQTQTITADTSQGYGGLTQVGVTVNAIPSTYVGSGVTTRSSSSLTANGATVTAPAGYYASAATKAIATGTVTAPSEIYGTEATLGYSKSSGYITLRKIISVTPTVTSAGYISSGTAGNSTVDLYASCDINDSGSLTVNGATVTAPAGYYSAAATKAISSGSVTAPTSITGTGASVSTGTNTLTFSKTISVTPNVTSSGYISSGTAGNSTVSLTASVNTRNSGSLTASGATVTAPAGYYANAATKAISNGSVTAPTSISGTGANISTASSSITFTKTISVTPNVTSSGYISSGTAGNSTVSLSANITPRSSSSLTTNGATVTAPAGYYASAATKAIAAGSAITPTTTIQINPTISVNNTNGKITASVSTSSPITPTVTAGYIDSGTSGTVSVTGSHSTNLSTVAASTVYPSTAQQTAVASGKFTTGAVVVAPVTETLTVSGNRLIYNSTNGNRYFPQIS